MIIMNWYKGFKKEKFMYIVSKHTIMCKNIWDTFHTLNAHSDVI